MRILGRFALAAALLAPAGLITAQSANAAGGGFNCSNSAGSVVASPGLLLSTANPQKLALASTGLTCTGGFVTGGNLVAKFSTQNVRCSGMVGTPAGGIATATWTTPAGMGITTMKLNLKVTATAGHATSGTLSGVVTTTGSNFASGKAVTGTFALNKGLRAVASGGDCTVTIPLKGFAITALTIKTV